MRTLLLTSSFYGLLLMSGVNAVAKPIDQSTYLASPVQQVEKRQHSWPDGRLYDGQWLNNQPHGQGMLTYADGGQYWGHLQAGKRQGEGLMKFVNGDEYEGQWRNDQPQGQGVMRYADGARHEGRFVQGQPSGQGRRTYPDGSYYDGQWRQNVPHGQGRLTFPAGGAYEGEFKQGKPHGQGAYFYANGDLYEGEWKNGLQDGKGRFDYSTGGFYEGSVVRGQRQGTGVWVSALGQRYEGSFSANQPNGRGRCGTFAKMEPCTYRNGLRVEDPAPVIAVAPKPAAPATPALVANVAAATIAVAAAKPDAAPAVSETPKKVATPKSKPASNSDFTKTVTKEKQQLARKTIHDLRPDRSDIFFVSSWTHLDLMAKPGRVWWEKKESLFQDQLEILSQHGDTRIRMVIEDYKGPGRYTLSQVKVESPSQSFNADNDEIGQIDIQSDNGSWISGQFHFNVQTSNGRALDIQDGVFRISEVSMQPRFLR